MTCLGSSPSKQDSQLLAVRLALKSLKLRKYSRDPALDVVRLQSLQALIDARGAAETFFKAFPTQNLSAQELFGANITIRRPSRYYMDSNQSNLKPQHTLGTTPEAACQSGQVTDSGSSAVGGRRLPRTPFVQVSLDVAANTNFSEALRHVVNGGKAARAGWNGAGQYVFAQYPDQYSKMTAPYLVLKNTQGGFLPWAPSQGDVFATDWALLPGSWHDVA